MGKDPLKLLGGKSTAKQLLDEIADGEKTREEIVRKRTALDRERSDILLDASDAALDDGTTLNVKTI